MPFPTLVAHSPPGARVPDPLATVILIRTLTEALEKKTSLRLVKTSNSMTMKVTMTKKNPDTAREFTVMESDT